MKTDIISVIEKKKVGFSKRQKMIAEYIIENCDKAAYLKASKLAEKIGVSESTVVRFATEVGCEGYPDFAEKLKEAAKNRLTAMQRMQIAEEKIGHENVFDNVMKSDIVSIEKTLQNIDAKQFDGAVEALSSAKHIYIMGTRSAATLAEFAGFYLNMIFDNVHTITATGDDMFKHIIRVTEKDVVLGISLPRYSKNTVKALEYASRQGATVIGITDSENSPIVKEANYCLFALGDTVSFVDSLVAPFSVLNALVVATGIKNKEKMEATYDKLERIWDEYEVYNKE